MNVITPPPPPPNYANTNILGSLYIERERMVQPEESENKSIHEKSEHGLSEVLNGLGNVKLKKVEKIRDVSAPALWRAQQVYQSRKEQGTEKLNPEYLLQLPTGYESDPKRKWPLILYLHGSDHRGNDINIIKGAGPPYWRESHADFPFIVLSPQCMLGFHNGWEGTFQELDQLLEKVITTYQVDIDQIHVTGLSMGGYGTWAMGLAYPHRFASIAPVCGGGDPTRVGPHHKDLGVWIFHGDKDFVVLPAEALKMKAAMEAVGGKVGLSLVEGLNHDSIVEYAYGNPEIYDWFLKQTRKIS